MVTSKSPMPVSLELVGGYDIKPLIFWYPSCRKIRSSKLYIPVFKLNGPCSIIRSSNYQAYAVVPELEIDVDSSSMCAFVLCLKTI